MEKEKIAIRYIVNNVDESISFYKDYLDFSVEMHPAPGFALLSKGDLKLLLNQPGEGGAGQEISDGILPEPGGWNRIQFTVDDIEAVCNNLKNKGARFRNEIVEGKGGKQALLRDPSGNLIELFEAKDKREKKVSYIPEGYHTVTPFIATDEPQKLIQFIEAAFSGKVSAMMKSDDGVIRHATAKIGDSLIMISQGTNLYTPQPMMLHLYIEDVDASYKRSINAGARSVEEPHDEFYGDRRAGVKDKWGNTWWLATHQEDMNAEELKKREKQFRDKMKVSK